MGCLNSTTDSQEEMKKNQRKKRRVVDSGNTDIRKNYEFISMLGNGAFGKVRLYRDKYYKNSLYAIKTLKKVDIPSYQFNLIKSEVSILSSLDHPNIVGYFGCFEDDYYIHIQMEYLRGHDLNKIIALKKYTGFDEKDMCKIIQQLLQALSFIHGKNIVHRDIKPENILFSNKRDYTTLKLIDFGLATAKKDNKSVGTPYYMSPEMIDGQSCAKSDIWSVGVIVYLMLTDKFPFDTKDNKDLFTTIKTKDYDVVPLEESECTEEAQDFIKGCLQKKIKDRFSTQDCLNHPWIGKFCAKGEAKLLTNDTVNTLLEFSHKSALQKEIYYFIAKISKENEIAKLKNFFTQLDENNTGFLTKDKIEKAFKKIGIEMSEDELRNIWEGLDFHKEGQINYSEFLAAMMSTYNFDKEEKLWSVFNFFKEKRKDKDYITFESLTNSIKALNLNIDEGEIKKCFEQFDKEIRFEDFKKLILETEINDKIQRTKSNNFSNGGFQRKIMRRKTQ